MSFAAILGQRPNSSSIDLSNYYTKTESNNKFLPITNGIAQSSLEIDEVADSGKRAFTVWSADKTKFINLSPLSLQWNIIGSGPDDTYVLNIQPLFSQTGNPCTLKLNDRSGEDIVLEGIQTTDTANINQAVSVEYMNDHTIPTDSNGFFNQSQVLKFPATSNAPSDLYYELSVGQSGLELEQKGTYSGSSTSLALIDNNTDIGIDAQNSQLYIRNRKSTSTVVAQTYAPVNVGTPTSFTHAATKEYVDSKAGGALTSAFNTNGPYVIDTNIWTATENFSFSSGNAFLSIDAPASGIGTAYLSFAITATFTGSNATATLPFGSVFPSYKQWTLENGCGAFNIFKIINGNLTIMQNNMDLGYVRANATGLGVNNLVFTFPHTSSTGTYQIIGNNIPFAILK